MERAGGGKGGGGGSELPKTGHKKWGGGRGATTPKFIFLYVNYIKNFLNVRQPEFPLRGASSAANLRDIPNVKKNCSIENRSVNNCSNIFRRFSYTCI